jgi:FSR family fosmidomycin resistance protein-like MFS transporter
MGPSIAPRRVPTLPLVTLGHLVLELSNNCMPVVYPLLVSAGRLTLTQVGAVTLAASMSASLLQPVFGHLSDRWDARAITALSVGMSAISISLVGWPSAWPLLGLLVVGAMIGSAAFHPSGATLVATSVCRARATAMSVFSVGGTIGAALSPLAATAGIAWLGDPRGTGVVLPAGLISALLIYLWLRRDGGLAQRQVAAAAAQGTRSRRALTGLGVIVASTLFRMWFQVSIMAP